MSNYQSGGGPYEGTPGTGASAYPEGGAGAYQGADVSQGAPPRYETQQFPGTGQPQWQGQQGYPGPGSSRRSMNIRSTFKTTEFWILVVVSIALLIAAAVTDQGDDNQGFGAQEAWKYVTALSIAYILSRGLTKFGGHERDDHDHH